MYGIGISEVCYRHVLKMKTLNQVLFTIHIIFPQEDHLYLPPTCPVGIGLIQLTATLIPMTIAPMIQILVA